MKELFKDTKNIMIAALLVAVVALAVGYAIFATTLQIDGVANVDANWDVEIISITPSYTNNAQETSNATPSYTTTTASFDATFNTPGDKATYTVVVKNNGSIAARLNAISPNASALNTLNSTAPTVIKYSIKSAPALDSVLAANGGEATFVFEVEFDKDATAEQVQALSTPISKSLTATIEYVQNTATTGF